MVRFPILFAFILLLATPAVSQNDISSRFTAAYELTRQKRFAEALPSFESITKEAPNYVDAHIMLSWCYLVSGKTEDALRHADYALLLEPYYNVSYVAKTYAALASNDPEAENYLKTAVWMAGDETVLTGMIEDCDDLIAAGVGPDIFRSLRSRLPSLFNSRDKSFLKVNQHNLSAANALANNDLNTALRELNSSVQSATFPVDFAHFKGLTQAYCGRILTYNGYTNEARAFYEQALGELPKYKNSPFLKIVIAIHLSNIYTANYEDEKALNLLTSYLRFASALPDVCIYEKAEFLKALCGLELTKGLFEPLSQHANQLMGIVFQNPADAAFYRAHALNYSASSYTTNTKEGMAKFDEAIRIAESQGLDLVAAIKVNYGTLCFRYYENEKAFRLIKEAADFYVGKKDYLSAEETYNNLGALYLMRNDYRNAATYLRKSNEIVEEFRDHYKGEQKLNFMARGVSSYQFLVQALAKLEDAPALFEAQNLQRSRILSETLNEGQGGQRKSITLKEFQGNLKADEAAIIYSLMEPGTVIINVVMPGSTFAITSTRIDLFVSFKQKYLDRINAAANKPGYKPVTLQSSEYYNNQTLSQQITQNDYEEIMELARELLQSTEPAMASLRAEFLRGYFDVLIKPVFAKLQGVKKLIIMPDGILNFLPFESLLTREGKYLIEHFDIRYAQSAEVKHLIETRVYGNRQKSLLAMGGATYENMVETAERIRGVDRLLELQSRAKANADAGKPQREIYAALGFAQMNYLPGTLNEVKEIEKFFNGRADVYTGVQMTENFIKSLSKNGMLKNYKIIHLATHGFAIPQIPQLSGIAMCIFPNMQAGEDGYLTAPEISKLGMQADLAVLSACETGLGKIYGGEGVSGLTQSLIVGGANAALVSLWPVSDQGTMYFMTGLYNLTENQKVPYDEAVNIMKRKFIAGEFGAEFQATGIWAPFVHYGK